MQIESQNFLKLVERAKSLAFFDIESTGLKGDYNSTLVVSVRPYGEKAKNFSVIQQGNDQRLVREVKEELEKYDCWVSYYGKMFDIPFLNTRLLKWGLDPIEKRHHIDLYFVLKSNILTGRRSQGHLLQWFGTPQQKMGVSADVWAMMATDPKKYMPQMISRCASDTAGLEALYNKTKHLIREITR